MAGLLQVLPAPGCGAQVTPLDVINPLYSWGFPSHQVFDFLRDGRRVGVVELLFT